MASFDPWWMLTQTRVDSAVNLPFQSIPSALRVCRDRLAVGATERIRYPSAHSATHTDVIACADALRTPSFQ